MGGHYILMGKKPVEVPDIVEWARYVEPRYRVTDPADDPWRVGSTDVPLGDGNVWISTVFLGIEHIGGIFESMTFTELSEELDGWQERCWTWDEAEKMHEAMVEKVKTYRGGHG